MKLLIITAVLGVASAAFGPPNAYPEQSNRPQAAFERTAKIIAQDTDLKEDSFKLFYETENGIQAEATGREVDGIESQGGFRYTGDDGQVYSISYSAGQGGYQPLGSHIPTVPPIPEAILKALEQNAADEAAGIIDDGQYNPAKYGGAPNAGFQARAPQGAGGFRKPFKF